MIQNEPSELSAHRILAEPKLLFGAGKKDEHPLRGLISYGPYSYDLDFPKQVRLAYLAPQRNMVLLDRLVGELKNRAHVKDTSNYYLPYEGFEKIFKVPIANADDNLKISTAREYADIVASKKVSALVDSLLQSVGNFTTARNRFDVLMIYLPPEWSECYEYEGFNLHDALKAQLARHSIPTQIITEKVFSETCRAKVMWGLSIALYAKAGGIPWKLADLDKDETYIGLSYAMKPRKDGTEYVTCCSQIFDQDGTGLEFVAYDATGCAIDEKRNPHLNYQEMQSVLSLSLELYQNAHNGKIPKKLYIHKSSKFTENEILGALDTFGEKTEIELIQIVKSHAWYGLKVEKKELKDAMPSSHPIERGTYQPISRNECLLWTHGNVHGVNARGCGLPFFKDSAIKPLPLPILLRRFSGDGGWHDSCRSVLALTKVDWNNSTLYKTLPASLGYSKTFASVIKHSTDIVNEVYNYRFFM